MIWRRILAWAACLGMLPLAYADPEADPVKPDESLIIFPSLCWHADDSTRRWQADIHAWIYEPPLVEASTAWAWLFEGEAEPADDEAADDALLQERLWWFLVDNERGKRIRFEIAGHEHVASPSQPSGHVHDRFPLPADWQPDSDGAPVLTARAPDGRDFSGSLTCLPAQGLSVISDVDDTIKISEVHDKHALLANTFLRPYRPVDGVADLFTRLAAEHQASFHYLSASPWQLYPVLDEFRQAHGFPAGSFHLKHFRLKDRSFFALFDDPYTYKLGAIEALLTRLGNRDLVLVGDSGEQDPEVYGEIARRYPDRVKAILIREVSVPGALPRDERAAVAFAGVDSERVHWFGDDADEPPSLTLPGTGETVSASRVPD